MPANPLDEIRSALKFYADAWQWDGENADSMEPSGDLQDDRGKRASRALALLDGMREVEERAMEAADAAAIAVMMSHDPSITPETRHQRARRAAITAYLNALKDPAQ